MYREDGRPIVSVPCRRAIASIVGALFLATSGRTLLAQEIVVQQLETPHDGDLPSTGPWNVTLGVGAGLQPRFDGSNIFHFIAIPFGNVSYDDVAFLGPRGLGVNVVNRGGFQAGLLANYGGARDESADQHLHDLGNIASSVQLGAFLSYRWRGWDATLLVRQAVTHSNNGLEGMVGVTYLLRPSARWTIRGGPFLTFGDAQHMRKYFGVSVEQSSATGLPQHSLGAGLMDVSLGVTATYRMTEHWVIFGIAKASEILGAAADSPIVQNSDQAFLGLGLAYHF